MIFHLAWIHHVCNFAVLGFFHIFNQRYTFAPYIGTIIIITEQKQHNGMKINVNNDRRLKPSWSDARFLETIYFGAQKK